MPIHYLRLPLIMLVGWWLYDEAVSLSLIVGAILIIAANAVGLYMERSRVKRRLSGLDQEAVQTKEIATACGLAMTGDGN